jgi:transcription initiation factor TFIIIB Brf1 subunit/transcription initiation factor TFIIB
MFVCKECQTTYTNSQAEELGYECQECGTILVKRGKKAPKVEAIAKRKVSGDSMVGFGFWLVYLIRNKKTRRKEECCSCPQFLRTGNCKHLSR